MADTPSSPPMSPAPAIGEVPVPPSPSRSPAPTASVLMPRERKTSTDTHPYAIKTTSTALLTRSNSTGTRQQSQHSFSPKAYHKSHKSGSGSIDGLPMPLPMPPSPARGSTNAFSSSNEDLSTGSMRRSSTGSDLSNVGGEDNSENLLKMLALPENPKLWTPSHLATYLTSTLRFKGETNLPARIAQDLSAFVYAQKLTGRVFLRLTDSDLDDMGVNPLWREALLASSRALRKRVLQGRIWGFGGTPLQDAEQDQSRKRRLPSTVHESADEGDEVTSEQRRRGHVRVDSSGRVRQMAASIERTGSSDSGRKRSNHVRVDTASDAAAPESEEEILSASDVSVSDFSDTEVAAVVASNGQPQTPIEIAVPDIAVVVETAPEAIPDKSTAQELTMEQLLAAEDTNKLNTGSTGIKGWDFDADNEGENVTAKRLAPPASNSRAGSRKGTTKSRASTIGRKNGAPLADLFRDTPEPPAAAAPVATASELEELRARVADLETRVQALLQRDEETRALLVSKEEETHRLVAEKDAETKRLLAETRGAHMETQRLLQAQAASDAETKRLLEENRATQLQLQVAQERADKAFKDDQAARAAEKAAREAEEKGILSPYPSQLPAYLALVGVGLCAVVMRSMMQKFSGRR